VDSTILQSLATTLAPLKGQNDTMLIVRQDIQDFHPEVPPDRSISFPNKPRTSSLPE
jgi:hypothetical protein